MNENLSDIIIGVILIILIIVCTLIYLKIKENKELDKKSTLKSIKEAHDAQNL